MNMKLLLSISVLLIVLNAVPRINDLVVVKTRTNKEVARLLALCITVLTGAWLVLSLYVPDDLSADWAVTLFLASIAIAWTCSPLVSNWFDFVFRHGEPERYSRLQRRKADRVPPGEEA
jgi:hypothetical protein